MNAKELLKVLKAGFTAIEVRRDRHNLYAIWQKTPEKREWHLSTQFGFASKAACKRAFEELLKDEKTIDLFDCLHNQL